MANALLGFILAAASAVFNGSFAAPSKMGKGAGADPFIFNFWLCVGVFVSSFFSVAFFTITDSKFGLTIQGMVGGFLLVTATLFSFMAIPRIGLAIGQGTWGATAILVSFLWGAIGPDQIRGDLKSVGLSALSIALLCTGTLGILYSERLSTGSGDTQKGTGEDKVLIPDDATGASAAAVGARRKYVEGLWCAVVVGLAGGSILVPLSYVTDPRLGGIGFLPSFGVGCILSGAVISAGYWYRTLRHQDGVDYFTSAPTGILAGVLWNMGNACSILAMDAKVGGLSYGVAYPLMQCALFVSGLWGIFFFREVQGRKAIGTFFAAAAVLLGGASILGVYGPQA